MNGGIVSFSGTGQQDRRFYFNQAVEAGWSVVGAPRIKVDVLVAAPDASAGKLAAARRHGITIMTYDQWQEHLRARSANQFIGEGPAMGSFALRMAEFEAALGELRVTPRTPSGRQAFVPRDEPIAQTVERDESASWTAYLSYVNAKGEQSERRFTCHAIVGFEGATHVTGYCHERAAPRTFRIDRIRELACAETGEMFDAVPHFDRLRETGALRCEDKVMTDVARMLVFLARCDGEFHPLEEQSLTEQLHRYCVRFNATECMADEVLADTRRLAPDSMDMIKAMRRIANASCGPRVARFVLDAGAAIIDADGRHAAEETRWAVELSSTLKAVSDGRVAA